MSLFYPQSVIVSTTPAREDVRHGVWWQVFWLPCPLSDLPIRRSSEQWHKKMLREFPFPKKKGRVTAAGPLPILTGFPIKPQRAPYIFAYAKTPALSREKVPACATVAKIPKKHCRSSLVLVHIIINESSY